MIKRFLLISVILSLGLSIQARDELLMQTLKEDPTRAGVVLHGYEFLPMEEVPNPTGYTPFYISHYGRHGSRSDFGSELYQQVVNTLDGEGDNLTPAGVELLKLAQKIIILHDSCPGRLTDKGEREHAELARRMFKRAPEVFTDGTHKVRAVSSMIQRSIISMTAFTNSLTSVEPMLQYNFDTGESTQKYIACAGSPDTKDITEAKRKLMQQFQPDEEKTKKMLFRYPDRLKELDMAALEKAIYYTVVIAQDFDVNCNPFKYLSEQSLYRQMMDLTYNISLPFLRIPGFYERRSASVQLGINDFIDKADEAIHKNTYCADLRFGHDVPLLCLMAHMGVSGVGVEMSPEEVESRWFGWLNTPMASNIQLIFYKPKGSTPSKLSDEEILVKVLYNEKERTILGAKPAQGEFYYSWAELKRVWNK